MEDKEKNIIGCSVNGSEFVNSGCSELASLINRRSLRYVILLGEIFSGDYVELKEQFESLDLYIWTKKAIQSKLSDISTTMEESCDETKKLYKMLNNCINKEVTITDIEMSIDKEIFDTCKRALFGISKNEYNGNDKKLFVIRGFSLLNLFEKACFPITVMEELISKHMINALSPSEELKNLPEPKRRRPDEFPRARRWH